MLLLYGDRYWRWRLKRMYRQRAFGRLPTVRLRYDGGDQAHRRGLLEAFEDMARLMDKFAKSLVGPAR